MARIEPPSSPTRRSRSAVVVLLVLAVVACGTGETGSGKLPAITLDAFDGAAPLDLSRVADHRPAVVNLWATWCAPCRVEMPVLDAASTRHRGEIRFVGVNLGDDAGAARTFLAEVGVGYPQFRDADSSLSGRLGVTGLPVTLLVARSGRVIQRLTGRLDDARLERAIRRLMR